MRRHAASRTACLEIQHPPRLPRASSLVYTLKRWQVPGGVKASTRRNSQDGWKTPTPATGTEGRQKCGEAARQGRTPSSIPRVTVVPKPACDPEPRARRDFGVIPERLICRKLGCNGYADADQDGRRPIARSADSPARRHGALGAPGHLRTRASDATRRVGSPASAETAGGASGWGAEIPATLSLRPSSIIERRCRRPVALSGERRIPG